MSAETIVTWQDKIPAWQARSESALAAVEEWKVMQTEQLAETIPDMIEQLDGSIAEVRARGGNSAYIESRGLATDYVLLNTNYRNLKTHYDARPAIRTKLDIWDDHKFDEKTARTSLPSYFLFRLTVDWDTTA